MTEEKSYRSTNDEDMTEETLGIVPKMTDDKSYLYSHSVHVTQYEFWRREYLASVVSPEELKFRKTPVGKILSEIEE